MGNILAMPMHEDEYAAQWCETLRCYSYPTVTFDFRSEQEGHHEDMRGVEGCIGRLLRSDDLRDVRDGLSCVLYWGFARQGVRDHRVSDFRGRVESPADERLARFSESVRHMSRMPPSAAEFLVALKRLKLPQFSQMSFTTKILMFLDPDSYPVLDLRIAKAYANRPEFPPLQGLTIRTSIPLTAKNRTCYGEFACWARRIAARVNGISGSPRHDLRAVDVERALFTLVDRGQDDKARVLLEESA